MQERINSEEWITVFSTGSQENQRKQLLQIVIDNIDNHSRQVFSLILRLYRTHSAEKILELLDSTEQFINISNNQSILDSLSKQVESLEKTIGKIPQVKKYMGENNIKSKSLHILLQQVLLTQHLYLSNSLPIASFHIHHPLKAVENTDPVYYIQTPLYYRFFLSRKHMVNKLLSSKDGEKNIKLQHLSAIIKEMKMRSNYISSSQITPSTHSLKTGDWISLPIRINNIPSEEVIICQRKVEQKTGGLNVSIISLEIEADFSVDRNMIEKQFNKLNNVPRIEIMNTLNKILTSNPNISVDSIPKPQEVPSHFIKEPMIIDFVYSFPSRKYMIVDERNTDKGITYRILIIINTEPHEADRTNYKDNEKIERLAINLAQSTATDILRR